MFMGTRRQIARNIWLG
jgi:hypothetical protein